jgi:hypothetical protein
VAERKKIAPKQVVYLWGAGATHAEAQYVGAPVNLLVRDSEVFGDGVTTRILRRTGRTASSSFGGVVDIEKLISLLAASGISEFESLAEKLRTNYFNEIRTSLAKARVLEKLRLATALFQLHQDEQFRQDVETLSGVLTTNHDGLLQNVFQGIFSGINLGFPFASKDFAFNQEAPPLLQLHGSFTWQFATPIEVSKLRSRSGYTPDTVWIPPTILKEPKNYPFNKLTGLAYELLARKCDVLRVVGASLTQNDWNILSLVFNAQRHREYHKGTAFRIELIMPHDVGEALKEECSYLKNIIPIGYLSDGDFAGYKLNAETTDMANPLGYWLMQKLEHHRSRDELADSAPALEAREVA